MPEDELWTRIRGFELDDADAALPFSARLARENGWSREFALRVVEEYRRFVFLAMKAGHPVTPSEEVDEAWHLHLCYTRSYWDGLCRGVLGRPLHHGPTQGGAEEGRKFRDWHERTLESYRRWFGEEPPRDIWPPAKVRFGRRPVMKVDRSRHWVIRKPGAGALVVYGLAPLGLAGCAGLVGFVPAEIAPFLFFGLIVLVVLAVIFRKGGGGGSGCGGFFGGCGGSCGSDGGGCGGGCGGGD